MSIYKRSGVYWITISYGGQRVRVSAGKGASKSQAQEIESKLRADLHAGKVGRKAERLISEAVLKWLDSECKHLKSAKKFESHTNALFPYIVGKPLTQIHLVVQDIKKNMTLTVSAATVNRRLSILRRIANIAYKQWGWLDSPVAHRVAMLPENTARHLYLTQPEVERLAKVCGGHAGDLVRLAAYSGLRRGELLGLTQRNIKNNCIILNAQTKTGRPRVIPLPENVLDIADKLPLPINDAKLRKEFERARIEIGRPDIHFHDLRHTYASWLVQAGAPLTAVRDLLGHTNLAMTSRYSHLSPVHLADAVSKLSGHNSGTVTNKTKKKKAT